MHAFRKCERRWLARAVDLLLNFGQRLSRRLKPFLRDCILDLNKDDAAVHGPAHAAEASEQVFLARAQFAVDEHHGFCTVVPGIDCLADQLRMLCHPIIAALRGKAGWFVTQNKDDLVFDINAVIVVIAEFAGRSAVPDKNNRSADGAGCRKTEWNKLLVQLQFSLVHLKPIVAFEARARYKREWLKVGICTRGFQSQALKALLNQLRGAREALSTVTSAFH